jgi:hypothetical protein
VSFICPETGHTLNHPSGQYCPHHGARLFDRCSKCGDRWTSVPARHGYWGEDGADFCVHCGHPGPWVSKRQRIDWLRAKLLEQRDLDDATKLELSELLGRLTVAEQTTEAQVQTIWSRVKEKAPGFFKNAAKPVLDTILTETTKRALDWYQQ